MTDEAKNSAATPENMELSMRLEGIFTPYAVKHRQKFYKGADATARFVHYTTAEAALEIIRSKRLWMRNASSMSDYREVELGHEILVKYLHDKLKRPEFFAALDACAQGAAQEALDLFDQWWSDIQWSTYIASSSEHDDSEDLNGRLSMWRAFGGRAARVAIVMNVPAYSAGATALNLVFSPVAYLKEEEAHAEIDATVLSIRENCDFLGSLDRSVLVGSVFNMLLAGVTCLKHEGFREEREWRVLYAPKRNPSPLMESSTKIIEGIPQIIYKIPLDATLSDTVADLDLARIFDRLIIGPSEHPWVMYEAFKAALGEAGVADAGARVRISAIPIRA